MDLADRGPGQNDEYFSSTAPGLGQRLSGRHADSSTEVRKPLHGSSRTAGEDRQALGVATWGVLPLRQDKPPDGLELAALLAPGYWPHFRCDELMRTTGPVLGVDEPPPGPGTGLPGVAPPGYSDRAGRKVCRAVPPVSRELPVTSAKLPPLASKLSATACSP